MPSGSSGTIASNWPYTDRTSTKDLNPRADQSEGNACERRIPAAGYTAVVLETNPSLKVGKIYEAIAALEQRHRSPIEPGSDEEIALKVAKVGLARLKAEQWKGSGLL